MASVAVVTRTRSSARGDAWRWNVKLSTQAQRKCEESRIMLEIVDTRTCQVSTISS